LQRARKQDAKLAGAAAAIITLLVRGYDQAETAGRLAISPRLIRRLARLAAA
jgi:hypothetical protein